MMREFHALVSYLDVIFRQTVRVLSLRHVTSEVCWYVLCRAALKAAKNKLYLQ
jgi:hypothetical protein